MAAFKFKEFSVHQLDAVQKVSTDTLVLGATVSADNPINILDVGTGTGAIALMMAQRFPKAKVLGIDIDPAAVDLCQLNFENAPFASRLTSMHSDFLLLDAGKKFDLIVANPPYYKTTMYSSSDQRNLARHEGGMPLEKMIAQSERLLTERGQLWFILPAERTALLTRKVYQGLWLNRQIKIYGKPGNPIRDILVYGKFSADFQVDSLTIREENGAYTDAYKQLTRAFHGKTL